MHPLPPRETLNVYLPYRELLLNLEHGGLQQITPTTVAMSGRELEYDQTVSSARLTCSICGARDVKFVPFTNPDFPTLRVVRVCQVCNHAEEL